MHEQPKKIVPPKIVKKTIGPPRKFCAWCSAECEGRVVGIRYNRLEFITHGTVEAGEGKQEASHFCSVSHRHEYYFGM